MSLREISCAVDPNPSRASLSSSGSVTEPQGAAASPASAAGGEATGVASWAEAGRAVTGAANTASLADLLRGGSRRLTGGGRLCRVPAAGADRVPPLPPPTVIFLGGGGRGGGGAGGGGEAGGGEPVTAAGAGTPPDPGLSKSVTRLTWMEQSAPMYSRSQAQPPPG